MLMCIDSRNYLHVFYGQPFVKLGMFGVRRRDKCGDNNWLYFCCLLRRIVQKGFYLQFVHLRTMFLHRLHLTLQYQAQTL